MTVGFYIAAAIALLATLRVITSYKPVHALLYLIASFLANAVVFFTLGAPFAAALEVIVYAGAIMVLFVFVVMLLNLGDETEAQEQAWLQPRMWIGPGLMALVLLLQMGWLLVAGDHRALEPQIPVKSVGLALYGPYLLMVELASMLLLAGLVGAYHLAPKREQR
ncbi:MAG: NADH-quinone oxidoreductase subunit J [Salinisphaeraceae bacterium]|nr:NADH-quinone oxidoreductase subunit J [Salinisphaeraceae bacterium]